MEVGFSFSLSFEDTHQTHPFGIGFLNEAQSLMVRSVETEFENLSSSHSHIRLTSPEGETLLSANATHAFKERLRELLEEFLSYVHFRVSVFTNPMSQSTHTLTSKEYKTYIQRLKGSRKLASQLQCCEERVCPICLENLEYNRIWHSPHCGHLFHPKCLHLYLTKKCITHTCPVCRKDVKTNTQVES